MLESSEDNMNLFSHPVFCPSETACVLMPTLPFPALLLSQPPLQSVSSICLVTAVVMCFRHSTNHVFTSIRVTHLQKVALMSLTAPPVHV